MYTLVGMKARLPSNKEEIIVGQLRQVDGQWKVEGPYGTFPILKVNDGQTEGEVEARVQHGVVVSFNFAPKFRG